MTVASVFFTRWLSCATSKSRCDSARLRSVMSAIEAIQHRSRSEPNTEDLQAIQKGAPQEHGGQAGILLMHAASAMADVDTAQEAPSRWAKRNSRDQ
jgi:hypothetical protein